MFYKEIMKLGEQALIQAGVDEPNLTSQILLFHITKKKRVNMFIEDEIKVNEKEKQDFIDAIHRVILGEPIQYVIGETFFMDRKIYIKRGVFIPRPDTELIVEKCLKELYPVKNPLILDIGTGAGVIAISLAHFRRDARIIATDISEIAIKQAKFNADLNNVNDNIYFFVGSLYDSLRIGNKFDLIVSNPPYIPTDDIPFLPKNVLYEPRVALDGGKYGVQIINSIIQESGVYLRHNGKLILEIDPVNVEFLEIPDCYEYAFIPGFSGEERGIILWKR